MPRRTLLVFTVNSEHVVKVVKINDGKVIHLRDQPKSAKNVSWAGSTEELLTVSSTDGNIYVYQINNWEEASLVTTIQALLKPVESDADTSVKAVWHPDGRAFAVATPTRGNSSS